jgi:hypothetical protein
MNVSRNGNSNGPVMSQLAHESALPGPAINTHEAVDGYIPWTSGLCVCLSGSPVIIFVTQKREN